MSIYFCICVIYVHIRGFQPKNMDFLIKMATKYCAENVYHYDDIERFFSCYLSGYLISVGTDILLLLLLIFPDTYIRTSKHFPVLKPRIKHLQAYSMIIKKQFATAKQMLNEAINKV